VIAEQSITIIKEAAVAKVHKLLQDHGKAEVLKMDLDRRVVEAAASYMAAEDGEIGFLYSGWAQSGLPHRRLPDGEGCRREGGGNRLAA
jgi:hypothetical protein